MLDPAVAAKLRYLDLKLARFATEAVSGQYASSFRGHGIEFDEVREYVPGDDIRTIDWHVSARMGKPFVKIFREEREVTVFLLLDGSPSMHYGSGAQSKWDLQCELAGILAYLGMLNDDRVGVSCFGGAGELFLPPRKGRKHFVRLMAGLMGYGSDMRGPGPAGTVSTSGLDANAASRGDNPLQSALEKVLKLARRRCVVVVISDFFLDGCERSLTVLGRRHDLRVMRITDPLEQDGAGAGWVTWRDAETGRLASVDTSSRWYRDTLRENERLLQVRLQRLCGRLGAGYRRFTVGEPIYHELVRFLREAASQPAFSRLKRQS